MVVGPWTQQPFGVVRKKGGMQLRVDNGPGCRELLPLAKEGEGFEFACVLSDDAFRKRGIPDTTLGTVIDDAVEEFVYAAADFVAHTANRLGLTAAKPENNLGLAA